MSERDPFADDVLERLVQSNHHYQRSHGHYIVPLAQRLLDARAALAEMTLKRDRAVKEARAAVPLINAKVRERQQALDDRDHELQRAERLVEALVEVHEFHCGCDRPGNPAACFADPLEVFELLTDSNWCKRRVGP